MENIKEAEQLYRAKSYKAARKRGDWGSELTTLTASLARIRADIPAHLIAADALELHGTGKALASLAVAHCNYGLTDRQEKRHEKLREHAERIAAFYSLKASAYGDPRGYVLKLYGEGLNSNSFAGDGYGVA